MRPTRKHLYSSLALFLGATALIASIILVRNREPVFQGKAVSEWILLLDPDFPFDQQYDQAADALRQIGAAAIPVIATMLEPESRRVSSQFTTLLRRFRILPPPRRSPGERYFCAARAACIIAEGSDADISSLVPQLTFHLLDSSYLHNYVNTEAGRALADAGPRGVAALTNLVVHPAHRVRAQALYSLNHALARKPKPDPDMLLPIGLSCIDNSDPHERWAAAHLLAAYLPDNRARAALQRALDDADERVRFTAESALRWQERREQGLDPGDL